MEMYILFFRILSIWVVMIDDLNLNNDDDIER